MSDRREIMALAKRHGWKLEQEQKGIGLLVFVKDDKQVNVYTTKMTVGTALTHPKQGKTQLFRRDVSMQLLDKIFDNPRVHTGIGYKTRR